MIGENLLSESLRNDPTPWVNLRPKALKRVLVQALFAALASTLLSACLGPPALHRSVLGYDETVLTLEQQLLLLNIARRHNGFPVHFTTTSNIAATFDWTKSAGIGGRLEEGPSGFHSLNLNLGASASENPTFSIVPLSGKEFTKRILTPLDEKIFEFFVHQGVPIDRVMRLVSGGIELKQDGKFVRFIENHPRRRDEYTEFRQIALHLAWIQAKRHLFVRTLYFQDLLMTVKEEPRSEDVGKGFEFGLHWRQKGQRFELTKWEAGRVVVTNYDPDTLSDREKQELNDKIKKYVPADFVFIDIRKDKPGGEWPITGGIKMRSFLGIIYFIANTIDTTPEFHVPRHPRTPSVLDPGTGQAGVNPDAVMEVRVEKNRPPANIPSVYFQGKYYSIAPTEYSLSNFRLLHYIYNTTVAEVTAPGIPITISK